MLPPVNREIVVEASVLKAVRVVTELAGRWISLELVIGVGCAQIVLEMAIDAALDHSRVIKVRPPPL